MIESAITMVGNLVEDPQFRPVGTGTLLATFRMACTERRFDRSQERWVNGPSLFMRVACWRQLAANVGISVRKGDRVLVVGRVRQRSYETKDGQRRVAYEVEADAVGVELTWRAVDIRRPKRYSSESGTDEPAANGADPASSPVGEPALASGPGAGHEEIGGDIDGDGGFNDMDDYDELDQGMDERPEDDLTLTAAPPTPAVPFSGPGSRLGTVTE